MKRKPDETKIESHKRSNPFTFKDTKKIAQEILERKKEEMNITTPISKLTLITRKPDSAGESSEPSSESSEDEESEYEVEEIYQVFIFLLQIRIMKLKSMLISYRYLVHLR